MSDGKLSLFVCDECGCVENTALTNWWGYHGRNLKPAFPTVSRPPAPGVMEKLGDGKARCSECFTGTWHGLFPKLTEEAVEAAKRAELSGPILATVLSEVGIPGLLAWAAYLDVLESGSVDPFDMGQIVEAVRPVIEKEMRERMRDMAAQKDEWAKDPEASWNAAERTVLGREAQAIRSAAASLDKEADHA